jgi:hypothetical protein
MKTQHNVGSQDKLLENMSRWIIHHKPSIAIYICMSIFIGSSIHNNYIEMKSHRYWHSFELLRLNFISWSYWCSHVLNKIFHIIMVLMCIEYTFHLKDLSNEGYQFLNCIKFIYKIKHWTYFYFPISISRNVRSYLVFIV